MGRNWPELERFVVKVFYSDHYTLPLPDGHRFPGTKYRLLRDYLIENKIIQQSQLFESPLASEDLLTLAHDRNYVRAMLTGEVDIQIIKRIGFPWSHGLYLRSCATVGGAVSAALSALDNRVSGNLAGGTHHAHYDRGEGYCVFNDIAVAARHLIQLGHVRRVAIIDLDVHQGNGNSSILRDDPEIFIFSMHGEKNYPFKKVPSHLDIALPDGTGDEDFLDALARGMLEIENFAPDFIFYQTGVDPLKEDKLGRMNLTFDGLSKRDECVLKFAADRGIPISLALGGGYADPIELSVMAYANTYRVVQKIFGSKQTNSI